MLVIREVLHNDDIWICWCVYYVSHKVYNSSLRLSFLLLNCITTWEGILNDTFSYINIHCHYTIFFKTIETCVWVFILGIYSFGNLRVNFFTDFIPFCSCTCGWIEKKCNERSVLHLNFYFNTLFPWPIWKYTRLRSLAKIFLQIYCSSNWF